MSHNLDLDGQNVLKMCLLLSLNRACLKVFCQNDELFKVMFLPQSSLQICHMIWIQTLAFGIECECRFGVKIKE